MIDYQNIPKSNPHADVQIFSAYTNQNTDSTFIGTEWRQWIKPRGRSMCYIMAIDGGGGGGGGFTGIAASARGGGGGGGSGAVARLVVPLVFLPDVLYIQPGIGGNGKVSGDAGLTFSDGFHSRVSIYPFDASPLQPTNLILQSGAQAAGQPTQGASGTVAAGGTAGIGGPIAIISEQILAGLGFFTFVAGQDGTAGGAQTGAVGGAIGIPMTSAMTMGGTGGGGVTGTGFAGGLITATAVTTLISTYRPINAGIGEGGPGGFNLWKPFFSFPGMGGGSANAAVGGGGGHGIYGSGGGGGGGGTTGGRGGSGGHGVVVIICW